MNRISALINRFRRDDRGAAAVEFSIVVVVFVFASMAVIEFGRTFQVRNELAYAADIAARELTIMVNNPDIAPSSYETELKSEIGAVFQGYDPDALTVTVTPETVNGIEYQKLELEYPMSVFIPFQSSTYQLKITRRAVQL